MAATFSGRRATPEDAEAIARIYNEGIADRVLTKDGRAFAADPPPETTRLRIAAVPSSCRSPEWIAEVLIPILRDPQLVASMSAAAAELGSADTAEWLAAEVMDIAYPARPARRPAGPAGADWD